MKVSIGLISSTADCCDAALQACNAFQKCVSEQLAGSPPFASISGLAIGLILSNPVGGASKTKASARFDAKSGTCFAQACPDYPEWTGGWRSRIADIGAVTKEAVDKVAKKRLEPGERELLGRTFDSCVRDVAAAPPEQIAQLGPVTVGVDGSINFNGGGEGVTLFPEDLPAWLAQQNSGKIEKPELFKLYRRSGGALEYHEAWPADGVVIEHWGVCGHPGETRTHSAGTDEVRTRVLGALRAEAQAAGFKSIAPSRHPVLELRRTLGEHEGVEVLDERHALEALLDDRLGWLGLGHCDGGSIGSGSVEVFCLVVDYKTARDAVARELSGTRFEAYRVAPRS